MKPRVITWTACMQATTLEGFLLLAALLRSGFVKTMNGTWSNPMTILMRPPLKCRKTSM